MLTLPSHIRGLVFDCDGTIADTMPLHQKAWEAACGRYGHAFPWELHERYAGVPTLRIMEILNREHGYRLPLPEAAELKELLFLEYLPEVRPIEPVVRYVRHYADHLPMAVATGGNRVNCTAILDALGLLHCFKGLVTADEVPHGKPAPDIYLRAAELIGVPPERCAAFEDAEMGLASARAAGMHVIDIRPLRGR